MTKIVNVGTIGHVDHGRHNLAASIGRVGTLDVTEITRSVKFEWTAEKRAELSTVLDKLCRAALR